MSGQLRGRHDLGEVVGYAYRLYAANFSPLFLIALITAPAQMLIAVANRQIEDDTVASTVSSLLQIPAALIALVAAAAIVHAVHEISGGTRPQPGPSIDEGLSRFWALFTTGLSSGLLTLAALFAFPFLTVYWLARRDAAIDGRREWWMVLVPGALAIYLALRWGFLAQAIVIEGVRGWDARDISATAVRDNWWRTLGILAVVGLIQLGPVTLATASALGPPLLEGLVTAIVGSLVLPFAVAAQTLLYYDLKTRKVTTDVISPS